MMKLKHLLDNRELVLELLQNWDYDPTRLNLLDQFRISSNAVYPFYNNDSLCFLRFAPLSEKSISTVESELNFMEYLRLQGTSTPELIPSYNGKNLLLCKTPWGDYSASVFRKVPGIRLDCLTLNPDFFYSYGRNLAQIHVLSSKYTPTEEHRLSWQDILANAKTFLAENNASDSAWQEQAQLSEYFGQLKQDEDLFGLVHYDYELDNVFYDETSDLISTIDFDDSHYHWYALDVERALNNIAEEYEGKFVAEASEHFLLGYISIKNLSDESRALFPIFKRYAGFYQYIRCRRALSELPEQQPEWMIGLKAYLSSLIQTNEATFGKPLE